MEDTNSVGSESNKKQWTGLPKPSNSFWRFVPDWSWLKMTTETPELLENEVEKGEVQTAGQRESMIGVPLSVLLSQLKDDPADDVEMAPPAAPVDVESISAGPVDVETAPRGGLEAMSIHIDKITGEFVYDRSAATKNAKIPFCTPKRRLVAASLGFVIAVSLVLGITLPLLLSTSGLDEVEVDPVDPQKPYDIYRCLLVMPGFETGYFNISITPKMSLSLSIYEACLAYPQMDFCLQGNVSRPPFLGTNFHENGWYFVDSVDLSYEHVAMYGNVYLIARMQLRYAHDLFAEHRAFVYTSVVDPGRGCVVDFYRYEIIALGDPVVYAEPWNTSSAIYNPPGSNNSVMIKTGPTRYRCARGANAVPFESQFATRFFLFPLLAVYDEEENVIQFPTETVHRLVSARPMDDTNGSFAFLVTMNGTEPEFLVFPPNTSSSRPMSEALRSALIADAAHASFFMLDLFNATDCFEESYNASSILDVVNELRNRSSLGPSSHQFAMPLDDQVEWITCSEACTDLPMSIIGECFNNCSNKAAPLPPPQVVTTNNTTTASPTTSHRRRRLFESEPHQQQQRPHRRLNDRWTSTDAATIRATFSFSINPDVSRLAQLYGASGPLLPNAAQVQALIEDIESSLLSIESTALQIENTVGSVHDIATSINQIRDLVDPLSEQLGTAILIVDLASPVPFAGQALAVARPFLSFAKSNIDVVRDAIKGFLPKVDEDTLNSMHDGLSKCENLRTDLLHAVAITQDLCRPYINTLGHVSTQADNALAPLANGVLPTISDVISKAAHSIKNFGSIASKAQELLSKVQGALNLVLKASAAIKVVKNFWDATLGIIIRKVDELLNMEIAIGEMATKARNQIRSVCLDNVRGPCEAPCVVVDAVINTLIVAPAKAISEAEKKFMNEMNAAADKASEEFRKMEKKFEEGAKAVGQAIQHIGEEFVNGVKKVGEFIENGVRQIGEALEHGAEHVRDEGEKLLRRGGIKVRRQLESECVRSCVAAASVGCDISVEVAVPIFLTYIPKKTVREILTLVKTILDAVSVMSLIESLAKSIPGLDGLAIPGMDFGGALKLPRLDDVVSRIGSEAVKAAGLPSEVTCWIHHQNDVSACSPISQLLNVVRAQLDMDAGAVCLVNVPNACKSGRCPTGSCCASSNPACLACARGTGLCESCNQGFFLQQGACEPQRGNGGNCNADVECTSNACFGGVCCDPSLAPNCAQCSSGSGQCSQCASGYFLSSGHCIPLRQPGESCSNSGDCTSNACKNGFCCALVSALGCDQCSSPNGMCIKCTSTSDDLTSGMCLPHDCALTAKSLGCATCNNAGACLSCVGGYQLQGDLCLGLSGSACRSGNDCKSGSCLTSQCCTAIDSTCLACGGTGACTRCAIGYFLNANGRCEAKHLPGSSCSSNTMCASDYCAPNGVCCSGLVSDCASCGADGLCATCFPRYFLSTSSSSVAKTCLKQFPDGASGCTSPGGTECLSGVCIGGTCCSGSVSDGNACTSCSTVGGLCTQCAQSVDHLESGICRSPSIAGRLCGVDSDCQSQVCLSANIAGNTHVCCGDPQARTSGCTKCTVTGACAECNDTAVLFPNGTVCAHRFLDGQSCTQALECLSGSCATRCCTSSDPGCISCGEDGRCLTCDERYWPGPINGKCVLKVNPGDSCYGDPLRCASQACRNDVCCKNPAGQLTGCTSCGTSGDCNGCDSSSYFLDGTTCSPLKSAGATCGGDRECASPGVCKNGRCCQAGSNLNQCQSCDGSGICTLCIAPMYSGGGQACRSPTDSGACQLGAVQCNSGLCAGGYCCSPVLAYKNACTRCRPDGMCDACSSGYYLDSYACWPVKAPGRPCDYDAQCSSGICRGSAGLKQNGYYDPSPTKRCCSGYQWDGITFENCVACEEENGSCQACRNPPTWAEWGLCRPMVNWGDVCWNIDARCSSGVCSNLGGGWRQDGSTTNIGDAGQTRCGSNSGWDQYTRDHCVEVNTNGECTSCSGGYASWGLCYPFAGWGQLCWGVNSRCTSGVCRGGSPGQTQDGQTVNLPHRCASLISYGVAWDQMTLANCVGVDEAGLCVACKDGYTSWGLCKPYASLGELCWGVSARCAQGLCLGNPSVCTIPWSP